MKWQNFELETIQASLITKFGVMTSLNKTTQQQIDYCRKKKNMLPPDFVPRAPRMLCFAGFLSQTVYFRFSLVFLPSQKLMFQNNSNLN